MGRTTMESHLFFAYPMNPRWLRNEMMINIIKVPEAGEEETFKNGLKLIINLK